MEKQEKKNMVRSGREAESSRDTLGPNLDRPLQITLPHYPSPLTEGAAGMGLRGATVSPH